MRVSRLVNVVKELELLSMLIATSLGSLFWALTIICGITTTFAIILTQVVNEHRIKMMGRGMEIDEELLVYYGTLTRSILSLFQSIADGIHWCELLEPLSK